MTADLTYPPGTYGATDTAYLAVAILAPLDGKEAH